jgi:signal recognition particle subunit SRP54
MFETLADKFTETFKKLRGQARISERNVEDTLLEVRTHLLEADVNYTVTKDFLAKVKERALGQEVMKSLRPSHQFVKIVFEELVQLMGRDAERINTSGTPPVSMMLVGLQGSGKTTTAGKLALQLREMGRSPYLVPADVYRPAAIEQLKILGEKIDVPAFPSETGMKPVEICKQARHEALKQGLDSMIIDTAGRLHIDQPLMDELRELKAELRPAEVMLVADAMTGQDAVTVAESFNEGVGLTGIILTKLDGDARGGAALSIRAVTGKPIKLVGVGEKLNAIETFHPERMASRILDMGDMLTIIERAEKAVDETKAREMQRRIKKSDFTLEDFQTAMQQLRKMGPLEDLLKMVPGMRSQMKQIQKLTPPEDELKKIEAIINSMTSVERRNHKVLNGSRRKRIARGSGTTVQDVNRLVKNYLQIKKLMKRIGMGKMMQGFPV